MVLQIHCLSSEFTEKKHGTLLFFTLLPLFFSGFSYKTLYHSLILYLCLSFSFSTPYFFHSFAISFPPSILSSLGTGGERGVPLQLLLNTWMLTADKVVCREVDRSYCLLKVFKDKGGDRKQKAEQQKSEKLPPSEVQVSFSTYIMLTGQSIC